MKSLLIDVEMGNTVVIFILQRQEYKKKYGDELCQTIKKKWVLKKENNSRDSMGRRGIYWSRIKWEHHWRHTEVNPLMPNTEILAGRSMLCLKKTLLPSLQHLRFLMSAGDRQVRWKSPPCFLLFLLHVSLFTPWTWRATLPSNRSAYSKSFLVKVFKYLW